MVKDNTPAVLVDAVTARKRKRIEWDVNSWHTVKIWFKMRITFPAAWKKKKNEPSMFAHHALDDCRQGILLYEKKKKALKQLARGYNDSICATKTRPLRLPVDAGMRFWFNITARTCRYQTEAIGRYGMHAASVDTTSDSRAFKLQMSHTHKKTRPIAIPKFMEYTSPIARRFPYKMYSHFPQFAIKCRLVAHERHAHDGHYFHNITNTSDRLPLARWRRENVYMLAINAFWLFKV